MEKFYTQHEGKVINDSRFKHVMAITLNPKVDYKEGIEAWNNLKTEEEKEDASPLYKEIKKNQ